MNTRDALRKALLDFLEDQTQQKDAVLGWLCQQIIDMFGGEL